jgi:pimeloyl-ACP methyl ester carboxylesterase
LVGSIPRPEADQSRRGTGESRKGSQQSPEALKILTPVAAAAQLPIAAVAFEDGSPDASWKSLPSWYVVATADQAIHPDAQRFMAKRAGADTIEVDASHAIALSQPAAVAGHIRTAATATQAVKHIHPA